ncbi:MAG: polysaccharide biosynthesis/export family protein [Clostridium sp.]|nr:polysaccharide biosynthesis/export family protein [Prevotella sp.]MCM1429158.1 polysaccharide biosynthesis/export family protein [Clostridium sp.]MCM1475314.1 polysaccharide biosynthesis/export family protein [Muribaculaceae bacterium]
MKTFRMTLAGLSVAVATLFLSSCNPKNVSYMQDLDQTVLKVQAEQQQFKIEPGDKVSIIVHSKDPALASLFNLPVVTNRAASPSLNSGGTTTVSYDIDQGMSAYTVSPSGDIEFPILGKLHIAGMTRNEVVGFIKGELVGRNLIKDPTVTVELINTGFSILGEVKQPGRYNINRDNLNVLEALALAGDLNIQGNRQNVKLIRTQADGTTQAYLLDLTNANGMMSSPAFYLKQNDIIYVEPNGVRKRETTVNGNTALSAGFWVSVASLLTSISVLIFK